MNEETNQQYRTQPEYVMSLANTITGSGVLNSAYHDQASFFPSILGPKFLSSILGPQYLSSILGPNLCYVNVTYIRPIDISRMSSYLFIS